MTSDKKVIKKATNAEIYKLCLNGKNKTKAIWEIINKAAGKGPQYVQKLNFIMEQKKMTDLQRVTGKLNPPKRQELHMNKTNSSYLNCQMS